MSELNETAARLYAVFRQRFLDDRHTDSSLGDRDADALRDRLRGLRRETLSPHDVTA